MPSPLLDRGFFEFVLLDQFEDEVFLFFRASPDFSAAVAIIVAGGRIGSRQETGLSE